VVHEPEDEAAVKVMDRAAMVVLDFFDGVPVTVTHDPAVTALTASAAVWVKVVVPDQLTVVCPDVPCTSMEVPEMDATWPVVPAPAGGALAAPAPSAMATTARALSTTAPAVPPQTRGDPPMCNRVLIAVVPSFVA
jgi:hypothetical protein